MLRVWEEDQPERIILTSSLSLYAAVVRDGYARNQRVGEKKMTTKLTGFEAIEYAEARSLRLNKYNDPTEAAREDLTPDEARAVAREDARLIWIETDVTAA